MAIGPVQLLVLGFDHPDFRGEIIEALARLQESRTVRVIDSLAVYKDADGEIEVQHLSTMPDDEADELGRVVRALVGLGIEGEDEVDDSSDDLDADDVFSEEDGWDVVQDIPNDTAAALVLIEHHWAVPLRDAIMRAGGFRISDGFISPLDLRRDRADRRRGGRRAARDRGRRRPLTGVFSPRAPAPVVPRRGGAPARPASTGSGRC